MIHIPIHILSDIFETTNHNVCWAYHFYAFKFASNQPSKNSWPAQPLVLLAVGPDAALGNTWKPTESRSVFAMRSTVHKHLKQSVVSLAFIYLWNVGVWTSLKCSKCPKNQSQSPQCFGTLQSLWKQPVLCNRHWWRRHRRSHLWIQGVPTASF